MKLPTTTARLQWGPEIKLFTNEISAALNRSTRWWLISLLLAQGLWAGTPPQTVSIGNGSGHLHYPDAQRALGLKPGDTIYIRPGTYLGLSLGNLAGSATAPITVRCDSNAVFTTRDPQPNEFTNTGSCLLFDDWRKVFRPLCDDDSSGSCAIK